MTPGSRRCGASSRRRGRTSSTSKISGCRRAKSLRKVSPLADWSWPEVWAYVKSRGLPFLPLYDQGYTSIGCEPCTAKPADPENLRSGRWGGKKLECGIHIQAEERHA